MSTRTLSPIPYTPPPVPGRLHAPLPVPEVNVLPPKEGWALWDATVRMQDLEKTSCQ